MKLTFDEVANALYIELREGKSASTVALDEGTNVDLDEGANVLGIEVIVPGRAWPLDEILRRFGVRDLDVELLRSVWPKEGTPAPTRPFELSPRRR